MKISRRDVLLGGVASVVVSACARTQPSDEIVIGALYPLSGASAAGGVDARHALEAAADVINTAMDLDLPLAKSAGLAGLGGAKVKILYADHQGDPQKGRAEAERLITQQRVAALIGTYQSSVAASVSQTAERYGVPLMGAEVSSPSLHRRGLKFFFRAAAHDEMFSKVMFDFFDDLRKKGTKIETLALFHEDTIFGTDSANTQIKLAAERGYRITADIKYRSNSPSLTAEVQQLKAADADALMPSSYTTDSILLVRTMAELGYKPKAIVAQAGGFSEDSFYAAVGDKLDGVISRSSFSLDLAARRPSIAKVNALVKARSGKDLNDYTARQFMALLILADGIDRAKSTDGETIRAALAATDLPGDQTIMPWTRVRFDETGQNNDADPVLLQYVKGKFVTIFPAHSATAETLWPMNPAPVGTGADVLMTADTIVQSLLSGLLTGLIYALIAVGLSLIFGLMDVVNFAHGEFLMAAMYATLGFTVFMAIDPILVAPLVAALLFVFGALVYVGIVRFAMRARTNVGMVQIFSTFGLAILMRGLAQFFFTPDYRSIQHAWTSGRTFSLGGIYLPAPQLVGALVSLGAFAALFLLITRTDFGKALEATREDAGAVALVGINANRIFMLGWGLGSALVGLAGAVLAMFFYIYPDVGASFALIAYVTVALGGFGSVFGALAAGVIVGLVEAITAMLLPPSLKSVGIYAVYLVVVFVRPRGLFGSM